MFLRLKEGLKPGLGRGEGLGGCEGGGDLAGEGFWRRHGFS